MLTLYFLFIFAFPRQPLHFTPPMCRVWRALTYITSHFGRRPFTIRVYEYMASIHLPSNLANAELDSLPDRQQDGLLGDRKNVRQTANVPLK